MTLEGSEISSRQAPSSLAPTIACYYYPGWFKDPERTIRGRSGASEWDLVCDETAQRAYPDIRRPLNGRSDPAVDGLEHECQLASSFGIDAFIWCWYWDRSRLLLNETLEMFLQARKPSGFKYCLMWVNKRPHFELPLVTRRRVPLLDRMIRTDEFDFAKMTEHLASAHWSRSDYLVVENRPVVFMYHADFLMSDLGVARVARLLENGHETAHRLGFDGVHYVAIAHRLPPLVPIAGIAATPVPLGPVGFTAISNYVYLPDWKGPDVQRYDELVSKRAEEWPKLAKLHQVRLWPSVCPGWDGRPRAHPNGKVQSGYPWTPRVVGETPAAFSRALDLWRDFAMASDPVPVLPVASWNEWTEGHAVAPCDRHGDAFLKALRVFRSAH